MASATATFIQNPALDERLVLAAAWIALPEAEAKPTAVWYKDSPYRVFSNMGMRYCSDNSSNVDFPTAESKLRPRTTTACRSFNEASNNMPRSCWAEPICHSLYNPSAYSRVCE